MVDVCKEHGLLAESDTGQLLRLEQYPLFMLGQVRVYTYTIIYVHVHVYMCLCGRKGP